MCVVENVVENVAAVVENVAVVQWMNGVAGQEEVSARPTLCIRLIEVARVAMDSKHHVTCQVCENSLLLEADIVKKLSCVCHGPLSRLCLLRAERAEWHGKRGVDSSPQIEELADDSLDEFGSVSVEERRRVALRSVLFLSAVLRWSVGVRSVLAFARTLVIELPQRLVNVTRHAQMDLTS